LLVVLRTCQEFCWAKDSIEIKKIRRIRVDFVGEINFWIKAKKSNNLEYKKPPAKGDFFKL